MLNKNKMLFLSIILAIITGSLIWKFFIENYQINDYEIPVSQNITFNDQSPRLIDTTILEKEFEKSQNKPILLYLYTTWCQVCNKNFSVINDISQEFQNTELKVITLAIDRNINSDLLVQYLRKFENIYFMPSFLQNRNGFIEFLEEKKIKYNNRIPFTILIARDGSILCKYSGVKSKNYLRNKIIKELFEKK